MTQSVDCRNKPITTESLYSVIIGINTSGLNKGRQLKLLPVNLACTILYCPLFLYFSKPLRLIPLFSPLDGPHTERVLRIKELLCSKMFCLAQTLHAFKW